MGDIVVIIKKKKKKAKKSKLKVKVKKKQALHSRIKKDKQSKRLVCASKAQLIVAVGCSEQVVFVEFFLNMFRDEVLQMSVRRAVQKVGAATLKALSPKTGACCQGLVLMRTLAAELWTYWS